MTIPDAFTITDVNVYLDQLTHTFDGDLLISILHPDTTAVVLSNRRGSSGDNFTNTVFNQEAATPNASAAPLYRQLYSRWQPGKPLLQDLVGNLDAPRGRSG